MIVMQCVDDRGGTLFHCRRQSQDRLLRRRILESSAGCRLWMNAYSRRQFQEMPAGRSILVAEDFLEQAGAGEFCFVEGLPLRPWLPKIERVILYRWNRKYPADTYLDLALDMPPWMCISREEFPGFSHPVITEEVYLP